MVCALFIQSMYPNWNKVPKSGKTQNSRHKCIWYKQSKDVSNKPFLESILPDPFLRVFKRKRESEKGENLHVEDQQKCLSQLRNIYGTSPNILSLRFFYVEEHMFICELLPIKITIKTTRGSWKIVIDSKFIVIESKSQTWSSFLLIHKNFFLPFEILVLKAFNVSRNINLH